MYTPRITVTTGRSPTSRSFTYYLACVRDAGASPEPVSTDGQFSRLPQGTEGLLLTGGPDLDPTRYGEDPVPELGAVDCLRDDLELRLLQEALDRDVPVLAICRGHQVLNVAAGGRLQQHLRGDLHPARDGGRGESRSHTVAVADGTLLAGLLGSGVQRVNSRHHQGVMQDMLGAGLVVSAVSPDGVAEGLDCPGRSFVLGVQWHPERPEVASQFRALFAGFVAACRGARAEIP